MALDKDLSNRLLKLFNYLKDMREINSQRDFCTKMGLSDAFFTEIKMGRSGISPDKLQNIQEEYKIYQEWLIKGGYPPFEINTSIVSDSNEEYEKNSSRKPIPLIPISAMAGFYNGSMQVLIHDCEHYVIPAFEDADFLINVKGDSMVPKYSSGDIVACKKLPIDTFFQWNKVYVLDTDQGALIKRIKKGLSTNSITVLSENVLYESFELDRKSIYNIALVLGVIRFE